MAEIQFKVDGTDRVDLLQTNSLSVDLKLNGTSSSSATIRDVNSGFEPEVGQEVEILDTNSNLIFGGEIDKIDIEDRDNTEGWLFYKLTIVDWQDIASRRIIDKRYNNQTAGQIVEDLVDTVLSNENITKGTIQDGRNFPQKDFEMVKVSEALNELSQETGYQWWIDPDKTLQFRTLGSESVLAELDTSYRDITVQRDRSQYRNRQVIIGDGRASGDTQEVTETITVTNERNRIQTEYPIQSVKSIDPGIVGLRVYGIDKALTPDEAIQEGQTIFTSITDWRFEPGSRTLRKSSVFDDGVDPGQKVTVTYEAQTDIMVIVDSQDRQNDRGAVEQGTGIHTSVERVRSLNTEEAARKYAKGLIRQHGSIDPTVDYRTTNNPLPGDAKPINLPEFNLTDRVGIVKRVKIEDVGRADALVERVVELDTARLAFGWERYYQEIRNADDEGKSQKDTTKYTTSTAAGSGGLQSDYETSEELEEDSGINGIDGEFVWGTDGAETDRIGFDREVLGTLNIGGSLVAVGNDKLFIGDSFGAIDVINDPIDEEGGGVGVDASFNLSTGLDNIAYSDELSNNAPQGVDLLWGIDSKTLFLFYLQDETVLREFEITGDEPRGIDEFQGELFIPQHDNFSAGYEITRFDLRGNQTNQIIIPQDDELQKGFTVVNGTELWLTETTPSQTHIYNFDGESVDTPQFTYSDLCYGIA